MELTIDISTKTWMSEAEASAYTTFCKDKLRELRDLQILPFRVNGRRIIYKRTDLDNYMENLEFHDRGKIRKSKNKAV